MSPVQCKRHSRRVYPSPSMSPQRAVCLIRHSNDPCASLHAQMQPRHALWSASTPASRKRCGDSSDPVFEDVIEAGPKWQASPDLLGWSGGDAWCHGGGPRRLANAPRTSLWQQILAILSPTCCFQRFFLPFAALSADLGFPRLVQFEKQILAWPAGPCRPSAWSSPTGACSCWRGSKPRGPRPSAATRPATTRPSRQRLMGSVS